VKNGAQALGFLHKEGKFEHAKTPHLIILDLNMPIKGGREVLSEVKEDPELKHIPIIVFTTSDAQMDIYHSYQLHANCYITKPPDLEQFYKVVSSIENFWMNLVKIPNS
jgi:CheY-like chemotaxis protein